MPIKATSDATQQQALAQLGSTPLPITDVTYTIGDPPPFAEIRKNPALDAISVHGPVQQYYTIFTKTSIIP